MDATWNGGIAGARVSDLEWKRSIVQRRKDLYAGTCAPEKRCQKVYSFERSGLQVTPL
jgi:hypothetical protein